MTEVQQGPTPRVRFREVSALTRCLLRGSWLYYLLHVIVTFLTSAFWCGVVLSQYPCSTACPILVSIPAPLPVQYCQESREAQVHTAVGQVPLLKQSRLCGWTDTGPSRAVVTNNWQIDTKIVSSRIDCGLSSQVCPRVFGSGPRGWVVRILTPNPSNFTFKEGKVLPELKWMLHS